MSGAAALHLAGEVVVSALLLLGAAFVLVGSYGLAKLPDLMTRLHAPTKASTLGLGGCLAAAMADSVLLEGHLTTAQVLVVLFVLITAPVSCLMIAKAHIWRHRGQTEQALPPSGRPVGWATLDEPLPDPPARQDVPIRRPDPP